MATTSGAYTFNQSASKIINGALRLCGAIASGETPGAQEQTDALDSLNAMAKAWMASGIHVWAEIEGTIFLQPNQNTYSIGAGTTDAVTQTWAQTSLAATAATAATGLTVGSITGIAAGYSIGIQLDAGTNFWTTVSGTPSGSTVNLAQPLPSQASAGAVVLFYASTLIRPLRVPGARRYHISSQIETPLIPMSRLDYAAMPNKQNTGTVTQFFFDPQMTLALLHVWPAPQDNTDALKFTCQRPLQDFSTVANVPDFPQEWLAALRWNLAVELAPEYDVPAERFQILKLQAKEHFDRAKGWDREPESVLFGVAFDPQYRS